MNVLVTLERNVTESVKIKVDNLEHLKELMEDSSLLFKLIYEQNEKFEEVCGEVLYTTFSNSDTEEIYGKN
jgi:hypothetical protein